MRVNETWMSSCVFCIVKCDALLVFCLSIFCWDFFSVMLCVVNDGRQISDQCWKVSIVPSISVLLPGLRSLCPHVILLISLLSFRALLCPGVPFFLFVQPQGQVVLCSSKPFSCSAAQDFILFWFSAHNTTWLKLYFAVFSAHCWAVCDAASRMSGVSQWSYLITPQLNGSHFIDLFIYFASLIPYAESWSLLTVQVGRQTKWNRSFPIGSDQMHYLFIHLFIYLFLKRTQVTVSRTASPPSRAEREEIAGPAPLIQY